MSRHSYRLLIAICILLGLGLVGLVLPASTAVFAQQPTGDVPTVTGTPVGPFITVTYTDQINVRAGPSSFFYPKIGTLLPFETAPAIGRSAGGDWIQIVYFGVPGNVGWVYAPLVILSPGAVLPVVEAPPTLTPQTTPTIDPTLAAAFIVPATATRLPTFTAPVPLAIPTFESAPPTTVAGGLPAGLLIVSLGLIGLFGALISFLRGR
jgi:hypothetical protein